MPSKRKTNRFIQQSDLDGLDEYLNKLDGRIADVERKLDFNFLFDDINEYGYQKSVRLKHPPIAPPAQFTKDDVAKLLSNFFNKPSKPRQPVQDFIDEVKRTANKIIGNNQ